MLGAGGWNRSMEASWTPRKCIEGTNDLQSYLMIHDICAMHFNMRNGLTLVLLLLDWLWLVTRSRSSIDTAL